MELYEIGVDSSLEGMGPREYDQVAGSNRASIAKGCFHRRGILFQASSQRVQNRFDAPP